VKATAQAEVSTNQSSLDTATATMNEKIQNAVIVVQVAQSLTNLATAQVATATHAVSMTPTQIPTPPSPPQPEVPAPVVPTEPTPPTPDTSSSSTETQNQEASASDSDSQTADSSGSESTPDTGSQDGSDDSSDSNSNDQQQQGQEEQQQQTPTEPTPETPTDVPSDTNSDAGHSSDSGTSTPSEPSTPEVIPEPSPSPIPGLIENNPSSLPDVTPKLPDPSDLVPRVQVDKPGVENGGIEFFGTKTQPQVIGEDGKLTPPPPPPGSGLPIPPDAITLTETFIGQPGGTSFNSPDVAVPVELTYVCKTITKNDGTEVHVDVNGDEHPIEQCTFLPAALDVIPGAGEAIQAVGAAYAALANIGNDMSPLTRKKAKKILVATLVVGAIRRRFGN
jgi:hypothetical protein